MLSYSPRPCVTVLRQWMLRFCPEVNLSSRTQSHRQMSWHHSVEYCRLECDGVIVIDLSVIHFLVLFGAALFAGLVDSIAGGGGIITVPALLAVGVPPHMALGTNKLQSSFGALTAALNYRRGAMVRFRDLWLGLIITAIGAFIGTRTIQAMSAEVLTYVMPALLVGIFIYVLINPKVGTEARQARMKKSVFYLIFGLVIGGYDGFFGPGTGSLWTMAFVVWMGLDLRKATAHTKLLNFTSNVVGLTTFFAGGHVLVWVGLTMGAGQVIGALIGSHLVLSRGVKLVRVLFLIVTGATIVRLIWQLF